MKNKIKISIIAILMLLIVSCSSSIEEPITSDGINPPDWVLGSWTEIISKGSSGFTYPGSVKFEEDDITIDNFNGESDYSLKTKLLDNTSNVPVSVISTSTSKEFTVQFNYSDGIDEYLLFTFSLNDDDLEWNYSNVYPDLNLTGAAFEHAITLKKISD